MADNSLASFVGEKADIVKTISTFLNTEKKGANYVAICPFHQDTNPSLSISPSRGIYKCFVCGNAGNAIIFVMRYLHISYREAILKVAEINGIVLPKSYVSETRFYSKKTIARPVEAMNSLTDYYQFALRSPEGQKALSYLKNRKLDDDVLNHFKIGYAPRNNSVAINVLTERKKFSLGDLVDAGIISSNSVNNKDRYIERIMFPIQDSDGNTIAFSGRKYLPDDSSMSKYINSPETKFFTKGDILYNLNNAKTTLRKDNYLYVLEGFMDVIALYRAGINSAVALMGTQMTKKHLDVFKRLNVEIRLCLDSDAPGQNGTIPIAKQLTLNGIKFKIVKKFDASDGKDADEVIDNKGPDYLKNLLGQLIDPISFQLSSLTKNSPDLLSKLDLILETCKDDYHLLTPTEREVVKQRMASLSGLSPEYFDKAFLSNLTPTVDSSTIVSDQVLFNPFIAKTPLEVYQSVISCVKEGLKDQKLKNIVLMNNDEIISNECNILVKLPLSEKACEDYEKAKWSGNSLTIPILKIIADYILEIYEQNPNPLNFPIGQQIYSIAGEVINYRDEVGETSDIANYNDNLISSLVTNLSLQNKDFFNYHSYQRLLNHHFDLISKNIENTAADRTDDLTDLQNFYQGKIKVKVKS